MAQIFQSFGPMGHGIAKGCAVALAAVALASCADRAGGPIPYNVDQFGAPDPIATGSLGAAYRIAPMDTLTIRVFRMPDLSGDFEVDLTGQLAMPLIGNVPASDLTTTQLDELLTQRFGEKYLQNPDVSVSLKSSTLRTVTVDGAVNKAGSFPVLGQTSLMQAVALAGGLSQDANARRVAIFRQISGKRQAAAFDLAAIRRGQSPDPQVYPGDIIVIDGSAIKAVQKNILNSLPVLSIFRPF